MVAVSVSMSLKLCITDLSLQQRQRNQQNKNLLLAELESTFVFGDLEQFNHSLLIRSKAADVMHQITHKLGVFSQRL